MLEEEIVAPLSIGTDQMRSQRARREFPRPFGPAIHLPCRASQHIIGDHARKSTTTARLRADKTVSLPDNCLQILCL